MVPGWGDIMVYIEDLIEKRKREVVNFVDLLNKIFPNKELRKILLFNNIPFKDSEDVYEEAAMMSGYFKEDIQTFRRLITKMYQLTDNYNLQMEIEIDRFCYENNVGLELLCSDFRIGGNKQHPYRTKEEEEMILMKLFYNTKSVERNYAMGHYAEYLVYEELCNNPVNEVYWISKLLGDGYGYDFMVKNKITNHYDFIEVKGTNRSTEVILSDNEAAIFKEINENNEDTSYHVYIVPMTEALTYDIIDVYYDDGNLTYSSKSCKQYMQVEPTAEDKYKRYILI